MDLSKLKNAINEYNDSKAATILVDLYIKNTDNFVKSLLLSNSLPEPIGKSYSDRKFETLQLAFYKAGEKLKDKDVDIRHYVQQFSQITEAIKVIRKNIKSNEDLLETSTFFEYSLSEQLQMFCIYIEDQARLSQKQQMNSGILTGMENDIAKFNVDNLEEVKISETDRMEAVIEIADTLFRFLYFKSGKSKENPVSEHKNISPYYIKSFEQILHLSHQRNSLVDMWGKFKFREWKIEKLRKNGTVHHVFIPNSEDDFKKERIGVNRALYRYHINVQQSNLKHFKENQTAIEDMYTLSTNLDVDDIQNLFKLEKSEYFKVNVYLRNLLNGQLSTLDDIYRDQEKDGIRISDTIKVLEYLFTIAMIYRDAVLKAFNEDDTSQYKKLTPMIDKENLIYQLSNLYGYNIGIAEKLINIFIFSSKPLLDVFSQPLIHAGGDKVIFCPILILQMNTVRTIEMLVAKWNKNISDKGTTYEAELRSILSYNPHIKVNTNKIEFKAYDGRDVEFDFIGTFEDHLLLFEFKHLQVPYEDKDKKEALGTIDFGIEQVNRREAIINNDWEKIKEKCSFELPEAPPTKIIKLLCTNVFDFTNMIRNGVEIIDSSSLLKFFMSPEVKGFSIGKGITEKLYENLWKGSYPTVEEFKLFLNCPVAVKPYINCYEKVYKPIKKIKEEDYNISFFDFSLTRDPYENIKIQLPKGGRNEPCTCGSGKKSKRCCQR
ncbi:SEC-C domain-containing protein [Niallia taxi]|uniref:YecA family protein n=1 Tax=Niallia taxi TaxID=2499688 RepID=UPI00203D8836|nr:SEC-C domain-containing protein [Niallia taxi]MCM3217772.1 SEC-C domain-containing protein [Niallia taxi]